MDESLDESGVENSIGDVHKSLNQQTWSYELVKLWRIVNMKIVTNYNYPIKSTGEDRNSFIDKKKCTRHVWVITHNFLS